VLPRSPIKPSTQLFNYWLISLVQQRFSHLVTGQLLTYSASQSLQSVKGQRDISVSEEGLKTKRFFFSTLATEHRVFLFQIEPDTEAKRDPA